MVGITVESVVKRFGETTALAGVSLEIEPGELFFLLGPSGCGKTTLLRSLAGFYIPESGTIRFGNEDVTRLQPHKRKTGMMFQSYALWPHMTIEQNVAFGLEQQKISRDEIASRVHEALVSVRMDAYAKRKPNQLSGGQQQRIALARALVIRPRCLLLDEPLSNLDAKLRLEMRSEIRRVCKEFELTTVYVTHDQKEALSIADRMAILDQGKLLQVGSPLEVYKRPLNRFVADFIGEANFVEGTIIRHGGGMIAADTAFGEIIGVPSDMDAQFEDGERVTLMVRPESIQIGNYPADENSFKGTIGDSVYYGEIAQYEFKGQGSSRLLVFEMNPRQLRRSSPSEIFAVIDPEDVVVIKD